MENNFWMSQIIACLVLLKANYLCGLMVRHKKLKVNYTRKIGHFALFFLPIFLNSVLKYERTPTTFILSMIFMISAMGLYWEPFRKRSPFLDTCFLAFDRPEDRPHTLKWLITQTIAGVLVMLVLIIYFTSIGMPNLIYIPVLINGIGDGLAEPVGVKFGKIKYETRALFSDKKFIRTVEGSACVLVMSIITVVAFKSYFSTTQFIAALISIPIVMTFTEAISPHTWDTPFLYTASGLSIYAIFLI